MDSFFKKALEVQKNAYAPYSNFKVGAVIKAKGHDKLFAGCNVENGSYGATICAERSAVLQMVSELGKVEIETLYLITSTKTPVPPCGMCLQVLNEFASPDMKVYQTNTEQTFQEEKTFKDFLPQSFKLSNYSE